DGACYGERVCARVSEGGSGLAEVGAVGSHDLVDAAFELVGPASLVDEAVVVAAQQDHVVEVGGATVFPFPHMVGLTSVRLSVTTREPTTLVALRERAALRPGGGAFFAADVEDLTVGAGDEPADPRIAEHFADLFGAELRPE